MTTTNNKDITVRDLKLITFVLLSHQSDISRIQWKKQLSERLVIIGLDWYIFVGLSRI